MIRKIIYDQNKLLSVLGFSATCCSRDRTETIYKAPLAAAIRSVRNHRASRDEITGHNTGISLLLSTSAWVL